MYKLKTTQKFEKSVKKLPQKQKNKLPKWIGFELESKGCNNSFGELRENNNQYKLHLSD